MNQWPSKLKRALLAGCGVTALTAGSAWAQAAPEPAEAATVVDEILVTAQRRSERIEDIPMVVAAVSGEDIQARGLSNLHDLGQAVAGVQVNMGGAFTQTAVRGVGTLTTGVGIENNVALYVDGYYQPDTASLGADFANLAGVEVLKGPQGTLWGRNATGGAILMRTLDPSEVFTGKVQAKIGNYADRAYSGYISGPITDRIRYSIAGYDRTTDGYYDSLDQSGTVIGDAAPISATSLRGKLEIDVNDSLTTVLGANYTDYSDPRGILFVVEQYASPSLPKPPARADQPRTWSGNRPTSLGTIVREYTATTTWDAPVGTLTSYTGYATRHISNRYDFDASFNDTSYSAQKYTEKSFQQAVDYSVEPFDGFDLTVGATYWNDEVRALGKAYSNFTYTTAQDQNQKTIAYAAFVDGTYEITDRLTFNFGGRYTREDRWYSALQLNVVTNVPAGPPVTDDKVSFENFSPRASFRYELAERSNIYASYTEGFRSGGSQVLFIGGRSIVVPIRPEQIKSYEVGYKTAQPWGSFEVAAFHYDYQDIQVGTSIANPVCPNTCSPINAVANAPEAKVDGVEATLSVRPFGNLEVSIGGAYLKAEYTSFPGATGNGLNAATQLNVTSQVQDWSGQQMARAPTFSGLVNVSYAFDNVAGGTLTPSVNFKYTDSFVLNNASIYGPLAGPELANKQRYREGAYGLVNLSVTWEAPAGYSLTGYVNNATDVDYHLNRSGGAFGDYGTWAWPRQYGVRLGYEF